MKILHIAEIHSRINGITEVISHLSAEQLNLGHDVRVYTIANDDDVQNTDVLLKMKSVNHFYNCIKSWKPDIVIFHGVYKLCYLFYSLIIKSLNIPYLIEPHGGMSYENQNKSKLKKKIANFLFYDNFVRMSSSVIYLCENEMVNSIFGSYKKGVIIPNGIDKHNYFSLRKIDNDTPINIIFLGRFNIHHKGLDILSEAIQDISEYLRENKIKFLFYGYGAGEAELKERLTSFSDIAEVCGPVYENKKTEAYKKGNIFILTSRYEGLPISILEALSYGLPCIITPNTNMESFIRKNKAGWITSFDKKSISRTIIEAVNDYRSCSKNLQLSSVESVKDYTWDKIAKLSIQTYGLFTKR